MSDRLEPPISRSPVSTKVRRARALAAQQYEREGEVLGPRIEAHLAWSEMALAALDPLHEWLADNLDLDLVGDTRPAAVWQMAGRSIGLARALVALLRLGYAGEAVVLGRSLHEANRLLTAFADSDEDALLEKWLADDGRWAWVKPGEARKAVDRGEARLEDVMTAAGVPALPRTTGLSDTLYDHYSRAAHNRRSWVQDAAEPALRWMARGPHPSPLRRAGTVATMVGLVEEAVQAVGEGLMRFYGPGFYDREIKPLVQSYAAIRQAQPPNLD